MNEFGEIAIDSKILKGKHVEIAELEGGCVCCSLLGEFEAAVNEILETVHPDQLVLETTGVAEPDALVFDIEENLPQIRLDGVITVIDADGMARFPLLGHTTTIQIREADLLILNKSDLVCKEVLEVIQKKLKELNKKAPIFPSYYGKVDPDLLFGMTRLKSSSPPSHHHQLEYSNFSYLTPAPLNLNKFKYFAETLPLSVVRAKGFIHCQEGYFLFNFVSGRWNLEPFDEKETKKTILVFIGKKEEIDEKAIRKQLDEALQI